MGASKLLPPSLPPPLHQPCPAGLQLGVRASGWGWGAAFVDMDNDAWLDLAVVNGYVLPEVTFDGKRPRPWC